MLRSMTAKEIAVSFVKLNFNFFITLITLLFTIAWTFVRFIYMMMRGDAKLEKASVVSADQQYISGERALSMTGAVESSKQANPSSKIEAFGLDILKEEGGSEFKVTPHMESRSSSEVSEEGSEEAPFSETETAMRPSSLPLGSRTSTPTNGTPSGSGKAALNAPEYDENGEEIVEPVSADEEIKNSSARFVKWVLSMLARNFYNFKLIALALAFFINFILLFYKVLDPEGDEEADASQAEAEDGGGEEEEPLEWVGIASNVSYLSPLINFLALLHSFIAFAIMVAYYHLKIPLVIFKREKEIARMLEFDGMWVAEQPADDDIRGHWDKLVISMRMWPDKYWDKFVKKKVRNKYSEQYDYDQISTLLGMDKDGGMAAKANKASSLLPAFISDVEWQYQIWKWGVIFTDNSFLYIAWYFVMSVLGNFNHFFFAAHLIDVAICVKTLGTILQSVTHNGKQLVLTMLLMSIVVYMYTVLAFNFFRKFYNQGEDGEADFKCHDMLTCFVFHLYVGVRSGGGIGDAIESPDGDPNEVYRIMFDITFFFFIIIILLAIIQGLIIDAFGELRSQLEQVREDLESSCFICGIGKDYFDKVPHGFEIHVKNEHNFANYMFFLMHLINKPDTEYTGQETYVWELYQQRCWDFFPVGECFRKQYETELTGS